MHKHIKNPGSIYLARFIKDARGNPVLKVTRSVNITKRQADYLEENNLNLSAMVRDYLESCIPEDYISPSEDAELSKRKAK